MKYLILFLFVVNVDVMW